MCNSFLKRGIYYIYLSLIIFCFCHLAYAQTEEEMKILQMFYKEKELVVTPTRYPKPISQVAENITIVTSQEIEEMNAHTLTDVLNTIPGIQIDIRGGPGSAATAHIQGSEFRHVLVMIDGVTLNNLSDNFADISAIPVQNIERIEIIKGPASSSWGSSLGGIINIITKSPVDSTKIGGTLSASYGERNTGDYRAEASGKVGNFGYYVYGGNLISDGFRPNTHLYENNFYTKLQWDITEKTSLLFTFGYNKGNRGLGEDPEFDILFRNNFEYLFSTLSLDYSMTDKADFNLSLRTSRQNAEYFLNQLSTGAELAMNTFYDKGNGGSAKLTYGYGVHNVVLGADFDHGELESNIITGGKQDLEKWAVFANDTIVVNKFSFTPGIRYDHTNTSGDFLSPSLGVTYKLTERTIFRADVARGFSIPPLSFTFGTGFFSMPNADLKVEKVWSYQAGIESTDLKYLWVKTTLFRHDIGDAIFDEQLPDGSFKAVNKGRQRRQGIEIELKTAPLYDTSFFAGFAYVDAKDRDTGEKIPDIPGYTYDIGIQYNNNKSLMASIRGHYIWWNAESSFNGKYNAFIWDINLLKRVYRSDKRAVEIFLTAHNIFNGSQYLQEPFKNPRRWIEGGLRIKFL
jgi:vitamin B12 transporter